MVACRVSAATCPFCRFIGQLAYHSLCVYSFRNIHTGACYYHLCDLSVFSGTGFTGVWHYLFFGLLILALGVKGTVSRDCHFCDLLVSGAGLAGACGYHFYDLPGTPKYFFTDTCNYHFCDHFCDPLGYHFSDLPGTPKYFWSQTPGTATYAASLAPASVAPGAVASASSSSSLFGSYCAGYWCGRSGAIPCP